MEYTQENGLISWECRYFSQSLPGDFTHEILDAQFHRISDISNEHDIYCFGKEPDVNIKMRLRTNTLKLKVRVATNSDGFDQWKMEFKHLLPAPLDKWKRIASSLCIENYSLSTLQGLTSADAIIKAITSDCPEIETVEVYKTRRFYRKGLAQLEVAEGYYNNSKFYSVQYESESRVEAQALRELHPPHNMGTPCSYTLFLQQTL